MTVLVNIELLRGNRRLVGMLGVGSVSMRHHSRRANHIRLICSRAPDVSVDIEHNCLSDNNFLPLLRPPSDAGDPAATEVDSNRWEIEAMRSQIGFVSFSEIHLK